MLKVFMALAIGSALPISAVAAPITYLFTGQLSGSLGGSEFSGADVRFEIAADTDEVAALPVFPGATLVRTADETLSFTIAGTSGTFTLLFGVFLLRFGPFGTVGLNPETGNDLLDIRTRPLSGYDLLSDFGPETQSPPDFLNPGEAYATSAGDLILADDPDSSITFEAILGSTTVPAPGMMALFGLGGLGLAWRTRPRAEAA